MLNIKAIRDIMRQDAGVNGDAQRIEQIIWILFLKIYDEYEKQRELKAQLDDKAYTSIIPQELSWDAWASGQKALTGDELLDFVNAKLIPTLKNLNITTETPLHQTQVKKAFEDINNYMKNGILLRRVIEEVDKLKILQGKEEDKKLSQIYENFLKELQSAGKAGEFYTPRALTDIIIHILEPRLGDTVADLACGTGGFLISAYHYLEQKNLNKDNIPAEQRSQLNKSFYGIEKKGLPFILCATNFLINNITESRLEHKNAFDFGNLSDLSTAEKFDIIAMNPPYGGTELKGIQEKFKPDFASSETADLFMAIITERLKRGGKAAVVLPDGFLFGNDNAKINLKKRLLNEFNLELILRLPSGIFAPYTNIATNVLFFTNDPLGTQGVWFYRYDMPEGIKSFSKTKPVKFEHLESILHWWQDRQEVQDEKGNFKASFYSKAKLEERNYNLDLCGYVSEEEEILEPFALIEQIKEQRDKLNNTLDSLMNQISTIIKDNQ